MSEPKSLDELRKKAHELNYKLSEENFDPREIEIMGYYLTRIAASYLSHQTHKELTKAEKIGNKSFTGRSEQIAEI